MMIFKFRILSGEFDDFIREIEIRTDQTFFDFHNTLQDSVSYDKSQMASFFLSNEKWEKGQEITLFEMTEDDDSDVIVMDVALISEFVKTKKQKILYLFDFFSERSFFIELVGVLEVNKSIQYPICTRNEGETPVQFLIDVDKGSLSNESFIEEDEEDDFSDEMTFENIDDFEDI